jgi:hypothetical protein
MAILDKLRGRRPAQELAANPRPQAVDGEKPEIGEQLGEYGGPTSGAFAGVTTIVDARGRQVAQLLNASKLTPQIIRAMRDHPQVTACLAAQSLPLLRAKWTIECEDDAQRDTLTTLYEAIHARVIRSGARSLWAGYSPNALEWDIDPETGALTVVGIRDLDPYTCTATVDDAGDYEGFEQNARGRKIPVGALESLWIVEGMESGNLYGRPLLTPAREPWQAQQAIALYHLRYLERFGEPAVKTRAPEGTTDLNAQARQAAMVWNADHPDDLHEVPDVNLVSNVDLAVDLGTNLRHHSVIGLPSTQAIGPDGKPVGYAWDLEYLTAGGNGEAFLAAIAAQDRSIARAMLVPSLLIEGGDTVGSNALGESHRDTFTQNVEARLADYAAQITEHLLDRIVDFNYGTSAPRARLVFAPVSDEAIEKLWGIVTTLVAGKGIALDVPAIAARLGLPVAFSEDDEPDPVEASPFTSVGLPALVAAGIISAEEARILIGVEGPAPAPAEVDAALAAGRTGNVMLARAILGLDDVTVLTSAHAHGPGCRHDDAAQLAAAPPDVEGMPEWKLPASYDPSGFARELNARERRVDFLSLERDLNTFEAQTIDELVALLEKSRDAVSRQVAGVMRKGGTVAEVVAGLSTVNVGPVAPWVTAWLDLQTEVWGTGLASVTRELEAFADVIPGKIGRDGMALVKAYAQTSAERTLVDLSTRVQLELVAAFRSGVSTVGLQATVAQLYDEEIRGESKPPRLTTRMLSSKALNASRADAIERGGIQLAGAQYSAILDKRTCALCERLDEQLIGIADRDFEKYTAPVHFNCRCVWVYVTAEEEGFVPNWSSPPRSMVEQYGGLVFGS